MEGVSDPICKACNNAEGTLYHRCCGCAASSELMLSSTRHREILDIAQAALHCEEPLFQHGVPCLKAPINPPNFVARWCGGIVVDDFQFTGDVYTDGAVSGGGRAGTERSGWSAVMINEHGLVVGGIYGTCPNFFPSSLRAELWGVIQALRHALLPLTLWVDNSGVVDGFAKGREWCCHSGRQAADLWRLLWWKVDDLGYGGISILKTKGHATYADIQEGNASWLGKIGNDHADHFAKMGAQLAEELSSTQGDRLAFRQAKAWYAWLATLVSHWPSDTTKRGVKRKRSPQCRRRAASSRRNASPTPGVAAASVPTDVGRRFGNGHQVFQSGQLFWCHVCGAYAELRFKSLKTTCQGKAGKGPRAGQLSRLLKGQHPLDAKERLPPPVRVIG